MKPAIQAADMQISSAVNNYNFLLEMAQKIAILTGFHGNGFVWKKGSKGKCMFCLAIPRGQ
jgi:hypothetical protein